MALLRVQMSFPLPSYNNEQTNAASQTPRFLSDYADFDANLAQIYYLFYCKSGKDMYNRCLLCIFLIFTIFQH